MHPFVTLILLVIHFSPSKAVSTAKLSQIPNVSEARESSPSLWDLNRKPEEQAPGAVLPHSNMIRQKHFEGGKKSISPEGTSSSKAKEVQTSSYQSRLQQRMDEFKAQRRRLLNDRLSRAFPFYERLQNRRQATVDNKIQSTLLGHKDNQLSIGTAKDHSLPVEVNTMSSKRQKDEAEPSTTVAKKTKYFADSRPPYVPPEWMSDEVKQYFKHWYEHAEELRKFNQNKRAHRPKIDEVKIPFVPKHALKLKSQKMIEDRHRKKIEKEDNRTEAEKSRDDEEWKMIQDGENLRIKIQQLHRVAVAKELGIPIKEVTREVGLKHGIPYGPWTLQKQ